ncbi:MAG: hypothetical protein ACTSP6_11335, partial [Promethearchaeota archaeon]
IIFSWFSKILELYSNIPYLAVGSTVDPGTLESWILFRIVSFRISFVFVTIGAILSYLLKVNAFDREFNKTQYHNTGCFGLSIYTDINIDGVYTFPNECLHNFKIG